MKPHRLFSDDKFWPDVVLTRSFVTDRKNEKMLASESMAPLLLSGSAKAG